MQHCSIDDPASYRLHQLGMWNAVKVTAEISINDLSMSGVDQLVDVLHCVQCAAICPVGILFRLQVDLEDRFENQHCRCWPRNVRRHGPEHPSDTPCRTAHENESWAIPSLLRVTLSATSEHSVELLGSSPIPRSFVASCVRL